MQLSRTQALAPAQREFTRPQSWERRLSLYPEPVRRRVAALANEHLRLRDLAFSFPALLPGLAVPRAGLDIVPALRAAIAGERLRHIAQLAAIPMWLRPLPPGAFDRPIPPLPDAPDFAKQIANCTPRAVRAMPVWLAAIGEAFTLADEAHVLWVAREFASGPDKREAANNSRRRRRAWANTYTSVRRLCLWTWYSSHHAETMPDEMRWSPAMRLGAAENAAHRVALAFRDAPDDGR